MLRYRVINRYVNRATGARVEPGTIVELSQPAGDRMVARRLVVPIDRAPTVETATRAAPENAAQRTQAPEPRHVGGGWYELPDGERVRGRDAAIERMRG